MQKYLKRKGSEKMEGNNQSFQQSSTESMIFDQNQIKKNNAKKFSFIVGIIAIVLLVAGAVLYFSFINNPVNVYKTLIKTGINEVFDAAYQSEEEKVNASLSLDLDLKLKEGLLEQSILDLLNKTTLDFNYQLDKEKQQFVLKLDSDYDSESLLNAEMYIDAKNQKTYVYLKDYIDSYLEISMDDYSSLTELFESEKLNFGQKVNLHKAKEIIIKEFTALIKDSDCSKDGDEFIFKISEKELIGRLKTAITNLKDNKNFLDCYEESETVLESLTELANSLDPSSFGDEVMTFTVIKEGKFSTKIKNFEVNYMEIGVKLDINKEKVSYELLAEKETVLKGYISVIKQKNTNTMELSFDIPEVGTIVVKLGSSYTTGKDIDKIDNSKVKNIEELTQDEQQQLVTKLQESKLYELITKFSENLDDTDLDIDNNIEDNNQEIDETEIKPVSDSNTLTSYDNSITIKLNIPDNFDNYYSNTNYQSYDYENLNMTFHIMSYASEDECLKEMDTRVEVYNNQEYYKNIALSEKKTKTVDGRTYYYKDMTYDYAGVVNDTKYYYKKLCTKVNDKNYLVVEITSTTTDISDSMLETVLKIK